MDNKSTATTEKKTCVVLKNQVVDSYVRAEMPVTWVDYKKYDTKTKEWREKTPVEVGEMLKEKCNEFMEFLRDHRSQDMITLSVEETRKDICSNCEREFELIEEDGIDYCACCGAEVVVGECPPNGE